MLSDRLRFSDPSLFGLDGVCSRSGLDRLSDSRVSSVKPLTLPTASC